MLERFHWWIGVRIYPGGLFATVLCVKHGTLAAHGLLAHHLDAPVPPLIPRTTLPWELGSYIWTYPPTCPALMLAGAFRYNLANPSPTTTTMAACRNIYKRS